MLFGLVLPLASLWGFFVVGFGFHVFCLFFGFCLFFVFFFPFSSTFIWLVGAGFYIFGFVFSVRCMAFGLVGRCLWCVVVVTSVIMCCGEFVIRCG